MKTLHQPPGPNEPVFATERLQFDVAPGLSLAADAMGPAAGRKVILLHGGGQSRRAWDGGMRSLAAAGFRAIGLDMRGHGESGWAPDGLYALEHWAGDLQRMIRHPAITGDSQPVALVGASRGGQSALLTAVALPHLVSCVVLVDVTPRMDEEGVDAVRAFFSNCAEGFDTLEDASEALSSFMGRPRPARADSLARVMRRDASGRWFWPWDPRMALPEFVRPPSERPLMEEAAADVTVPILLVRAGKSELVRDSDVDHFRSLTPHLEVVEVPDIGHMITGDSNDAFMPPVIKFLAREHAPLAPTVALCT